MKNARILKGLKVELTENASYITGKSRRGQITGVMKLPLCSNKFNLYFHIKGAGINNGKGSFYTLGYFKFVENETIQKS